MVFVFQLLGDRRNRRIGRHRLDCFKTKIERRGRLKLKRCFRCGTALELETDEELKKEYTYYCPECDENMYEMEAVDGVETTKIISETTYDKTIKGISLFSDSLVEIIGERQMEIDGVIKEQYLYNIIGHKTENGLPFISLKANIIIMGEQLK